MNWQEVIEFLGGATAIERLGLEVLNPPIWTPDGQRDLRTRDRDDEARVSGLADPDVRSAPTCDSQGIATALQRVALAHSAGASRARSAAESCWAPDLPDSKSCSRGLRRAREVGAGWTASRVLSRT